MRKLIWIPLLLAVPACQRSQTVPGDAAAIQPPGTGMETEPVRGFGADQTPDRGLEPGELPPPNVGTPTTLPDGGAFAPTVPGPGTTTPPSPGSTMPPTPGTTTPPAPGTTTPPAPGTTTPPTPGTTTPPPAPGTTTPPPSPGSTVPPAPGSTTTPPE